MKFAGKTAQRILGIESLREFFVGRKLHRWSTADYADYADSKKRNQTRRSAHTSNFKSVLSVLSAVGLCRHLHELDRCPIWIANINDSLPSIRTLLEGLRFADCFQSVDGDSLMHC